MGYRADNGEGDMTRAEYNRTFNGLADGISQLLDGVQSDVAADVLASTVAYLAMQSRDPVEYANAFIVRIGDRLE